MTGLLSILIFLNVACQSKPVREVPQVENSANKASTNGNPNLVSIQVDVAYASRRSEDLEQAVLLNAGVQSCLRLAIKPEQADFSVGVEAQITKLGRVLKPSATTPDAAFKGCLESQLGSLDLGKGKAGPFKLRILRSPDPVVGQKPKGILLDLKPLRKFE